MWRFSWLWLLIGVVGAGCTPAAPIEVTLSPSSLNLPSSTPEPCNLEDVTAWLMRFHWPSDAMTAQDIRNLAATLEQTTPPRCLAVARSHALEVYDNAAKAAEAQARNDIAQESDYRRRADISADAFTREIQTIGGRLSPRPTPMPTETAACPDQSYSCSYLSCAQAYACLLDGNTSLDADNDGIPCEMVCN